MSKLSDGMRDMECRLLVWSLIKQQLDSMLGNHSINGSYVFADKLTASKLYP